MPAAIPFQAPTLLGALALNATIPSSDETLLARKQGKGLGPLIITIMYLCI
jgi:hypothetical protein